jgi:type I restriction-modification system DNA methylase subunit
MQNTSHAVMAQRAELKTSLDDFPTPPWAARALIEHVVRSKASLGSMTCLEPACGRGHMSIALAEYFGEVVSYDVFDYGFGSTGDFLKYEYENQSFDWVITNPPYKRAEEFIKRSLKIARRGVAIAQRTVVAPGKNLSILRLSSSAKSPCPDTKSGVRTAKIRNSY